MTFELWQLFLLIVAYLFILFVIAYSAEQGWLPSRIAKHPLTYILSLGVYATSWSFYGSVGFAHQQGYNFLTIYIGVTLAFLLTPILLRPILNLCREYQLTSLADLFAFRYQSQLAGVLVTLFMLTGTLPYIALQVRAVTESLQVLSNESTPVLIAPIFCATMILFAVLFGARHFSSREKHEGLVVAIAFESLIKLTALLAVGLFAIFGVFDGFEGMQQWLNRNPQALESLYAPVREGPWGTLLLLSFAAAFLLPRQFHMIFTENIEPRTLCSASWGFPLFLLLLNLAIPPILWAGLQTSPDSSADFYVLAITLESGSKFLPILAFIGGVSAASAMIIVTTLALAAMCMNHLVLPASFPPRLSPNMDIYRWLLWGRRFLIAAIILTGFGFYLLLERNQGLVQLGLISFIAVAQFLPGIVGLFYWRRATRDGFIAGLLGGGLIWAYTLLLPLLERSGLLESSGGFTLPQPGSDPWSGPTFWSLTINTGLFVFVSLITRSSAKEREAAQACCKKSLAPPTGVLLADSVKEVEQQLARITGAEMAKHEVDRALTDLGLIHSELHRADLRRLRERIERNLSGLVGPLLARMIVDDQLQMEPHTRTTLADSVQFIEEQLGESKMKLQGLAAELDGLRRYHRQVLQDLPLGVCSIGPDMSVINWNIEMSKLSGLSSSGLVGESLLSLPEPWSGLFETFLQNPEPQLRKVKLRIDGQPRLFNLHKAAIDDPGLHKESGSGGTVILLEDLTEIHQLEGELVHSERLASIGRLAAGVAHEIGNPVTGIASLSQNMMHDIDDHEFQREGLELILQQTGRIANIVQSLVNFSHGGTVDDFVATDIELCDAIEEAVRLVQLSHEGKQLHYNNHCQRALTINGDRQRITQVFVNLLSNACDASQPGDTISIDYQIDGSYIVIELSDQGHGIPDELAEKIFEPFFTTKQPGEGTGLGLPLVYSIVQEHSGTITLSKSNSSGSLFTIRLPRVERPSADHEPQE
ncbi:histidine kinase [Solemya pervernicosa gill symbiont]|uniref:histidine kinase n=2 Tax=Gammaproteobacteria incertae sedis TaxID=118884 RepID=A0A1T2L074_9GAMM|nr:sensor histidine kinase [Candidatus Reidiella endopervernicosa]OOZ38488.1 histidine kinase [Solemya pervernicosa gill symbiont]QKQ26559.1 GHKL domain-containing protein [Candidatus Reidiella endopervernicosa]